MKVTIKDVAREANVATSTVSRVLSKSGRISDETKKRVYDAIKKLNYTPNVVARGLAKSSTKILAVVLPEEAEHFFGNPFYTHAMKGMSIYAQKENYYIMFAFMEKNEEAWLKNFTNNNLIDGIFLFNAKENDENIKYLQDNNFPFVIIGRPYDIGNSLWVDNDNFEAMYRLTKKLIEMGHKKIAFVGAKEELNFSRDRLDGYKQGLYTRGIEFNEKLIVQSEDFSELYGYEAAKGILTNNNVTAIIATDDLLAIGVQRYLIESGNERIALVGFNNTVLAQYQKIPLASVDINSEELGYYATKLLIDKLEGKENDRNFYIIDTKLIERESLFSK